MEKFKSVNLGGIKPYVDYSTGKTGILTVYKGMPTYKNGDLLSSYELKFGREKAVKKFLSLLKNRVSLKNLEWLATEHANFYLGYKSVGISFTGNRSVAEDFALNYPFFDLESPQRATLIIANIPAKYLISIVDVFRKRPEYFKARIPTEKQILEEDEMIFFGSLERDCFEVQFLELKEQKSI